VDDADLRGVLGSLDQEARVTLRVLIRDQADGDAISSQLLRYRDERGDDWADIIDMLTLHPDARRRVVTPPRGARGCRLTGFPDAAASGRNTLIGSVITIQPSQPYQPFWDALSVRGWSRLP